MAWNKPPKKAGKPDFISAASAYPLAWPAHWPRMDELQRLPAKDNLTHFAVAKDYIVNELRGLGASNVLISSNIPARKNGDLFLDYMDRKLEDPGVAVYFFVGDKPYVFACDGWEYPKDNLRAIGVAIGHIRACARSASPYYLDIMLSAFAMPDMAAQNAKPQKTNISEPAAIADEIVEPAQAQANFHHNPREWWVILGLDQNAGLTEVEASFRSLARKAHPDLGGNEKHMKILSQAVAFARQELKNKKSGFFSIK